MHAHDSTLRHLGTSALYTALTVAMFGLVYPLALTAVAALAFPFAAGGSIVEAHGKPIASAIVGQAWTRAAYFAGRPSAAGKNGYDPTATSGTNLGPTSKKLIDTTKATLAALQKANPSAASAVPMDLISSSASGIDPDISPEAAYYQSPRVATARHLPRAAVDAIIAQHVRGRALGFLGEPHVNVLELNLALDAAR